MRKALFFALALLLLLPAVAGASTHDTSIQQFFLPGTNTTAWRVHGTRATAARAHMNLTLAYGDIDARGGYKHAVHFAHGAVTGPQGASYTNLEWATVGGGGMTYVRLGSQGSVIGISLSASTAVTAGTATAEAIIFRTGRGSTTFPTGFTVVLQPTDRFVSNVQARGLDMFGYEDAIGCRVTTTATLLPITNAMLCTVLVVF